MKAFVSMVLAFGVIGAGCPVLAQDEEASEDGVLRLDPVAIYDVRVRHIGTPINARRPQFQLVTRLTGRSMDGLTRLGFPVIQEFVDDTGKQLVDIGKFKGRENETHPYEKPITAKGFEHLDLPIDVDVPPARTATKLARVKGFVNIVFGGEVEPVFIPHAKRYQGAYLHSPRLDELGIRIRMLLPEEAGVEGLAERGNAFALHFETGLHRIRNVAVYDDWLHNTRASTRRVMANPPHTVFRLEDIPFTEDCELGVYIFPNSTTERVEFEFEDIELP